MLFKTTRMDFVDLYRSLVALGRNDGLVQVLDLIEENNTAYAVREPDEGTPLLTYLEQRAQPLTQSEALLLLRPVVYGVEAMHRMGLLHRGISPRRCSSPKQARQAFGLCHAGPAHRGQRAEEPDVRRLCCAGAVRRGGI